MLRATLCALLALAACHHDADPPPIHPTKDGDLPPLPPSSGTPVGYLLDNAGQLQLNETQIKQLQDIDRSLSAKDDEIDTQLRLIEKPDDGPPPEKGEPPHPHNNAPGAQVHTTPDAAKLHSARNSNDFDALQQAFAVLDAGQQTTARRLLEDRGINPPGGTRRPKPISDDGSPAEQ